MCSQGGGIPSEIEIEEAGFTPYGTPFGTPMKADENREELRTPMNPEDVVKRLSFLQ